MFHKPFVLILIVVIASYFELYQMLCEMFSLKTVLMLQFLKMPLVLMFCYKMQRHLHILFIWSVQILQIIFSIFVCMLCSYVHTYLRNNLIMHINKYIHMDTFIYICIYFFFYFFFIILNRSLWHLQEQFATMRFLISLCVSLLLLITGKSFIKMGLLHHDL